MIPHVKSVPIGPSSKPQDSECCEVGRSTFFATSSPSNSMMPITKGDGAMCTVGSLSGPMTTPQTSINKFGSTVPLMPANVGYALETSQSGKVSDTCDRAERQNPDMSSTTPQFSKHLANRPSTEGPQFSGNFIGWVQQSAATMPTNSVSSTKANSPSLNTGYVGRKVDTADERCNKLEPYPSYSLITRKEVPKTKYNETLEVECRNTPPHHDSQNERFHASSHDFSQKMPFTTVPDDSTQQCRKVSISTDENTSVAAPVSGNTPKLRDRGEYRCEESIDFGRSSVVSHRELPSESCIDEQGSCHSQASEMMEHASMTTPQKGSSYCSNAQHFPPENTPSPLKSCDDENPIPTPKPTALECRQSPSIDAARRDHVIDFQQYEPAVLPPERRTNATFAEIQKINAQNLSLLRNAHVGNFMGGKATPADLHELQRRLISKNFVKPTSQQFPPQPSYPQIKNQPQQPQQLQPRQPMWQPQVANPTAESANMQQMSVTHKLIVDPKFQQVQRIHTHSFLIEQSIGQTLSSPSGKDDSSSNEENKISSASRQVQVIRIYPDPEVFVVPNCFTEDECEEVLRLAGGKWENSSEYDQDSTHVCTASTATLVPDVDNPFVLLAMKRLATFAMAPLSKIEPLNVVKYENGQYCTAHHDGTERLKTIVVYLNDVNSGGETDFLGLGFQLKPKKGYAVIWSNLLPQESGLDDSSMSSKKFVVDARTMHAALPPVGCQKFVLKCFVSIKDVTDDSHRPET